MELEINMNYINFPRPVREFPTRKKMQSNFGFSAKSEEKAKGTKEKTAKTQETKEENHSKRECLTLGQKIGSDARISKPLGMYQEAGEKIRMWEDANQQDIKEQGEYSSGMVFEQCYQLQKIKQ